MVFVALDGIEMKPGPHPNYTKILDALRPLKAHAAPYGSTLYRCVEIAFANDFVVWKYFLKYCRFGPIVCSCRSH